MKREEIERFEIVGTSGRRVTVIHWQNFTQHGGGRAVSHLTGSTELLTEHGGDVMERSDGKFELFDGDEVFTRV